MPPRSSLSRPALGDRGKMGQELERQTADPTPQAQAGSFLSQTMGPRTLLGQRGPCGGGPGVEHELQRGSELPRRTGRT